MAVRESRVVGVVVGVAAAAAGAAAAEIGRPSEERILGRFGGRGKKWANLG